MAAVRYTLWLALIVLSAGLANAQEDASCYGSGSIAASVILTFIFTTVLLCGIYYLWKKYKAKKEHLILETDPEKGKGEFAFDNPGFKDATLIPVSKTSENQKHETSKSKWNQWSPLSVLTTKSEKRKTVDDSALEEHEVKVIALRSHDFTGLGFNICGNMKEGIFVKDILHRGPAFESGKLNPGDRIHSVTISFEHMVYEDALTILSYASPYEVMIEAKSGKLIYSAPGQGGEPSHPIYRSSSYVDLYNIEKTAKKKLFGDDYNGSLSSNYSSLQKSRSNMTTLERKESKSPKPSQPHSKPKSKHFTPDQLKTQLEQKILPDHQQNLKIKEKSQKTEVEIQKTENKHHKFGIRVLPSEQQQKSPKSVEQNENNINIEKNLEIVPPPLSIDEVDKVQKPPPPIKKREKKMEEVSHKTENFQRNSLNGSGIKRDENGIPQEMPNHMWNAATAAKRNRKTSDDKELVDEEGIKTPKRKGKAPSPPEEGKTTPVPNFDEIQLLKDDDVHTSRLMKNEDSKEHLEVDVHPASDEMKNYNSDSDVETDNQSSVNTIELNSSEITIHQTEDEEKQNRKTVSTGDLTKIKKTRKSSTGTLERAQSLDISDSGAPKKRKGGRIEDDFDMKSDEELFGKALLNKEPRLSLILDGLNTFQRNRLKKSTEWGNLEDAILKQNQDDDSIVSFDDRISLDNAKLSLGEKTPEFDALVNKINEIKRESLEMEMPVDIEIKTEKQVVNEIWPTFTEPGQIFGSPIHMSEPVKDKKPEREIEEISSSPAYERRQQMLLLTTKNPSPSKNIVNNNINEPFENKNINSNVSVVESEGSDVGPKFAIFNTDVELNKVNYRQRVPEDIAIPLPPEEPPTEEILQDDWNITTENIMNTSPPASLEIEDTAEPNVIGITTEETNIVTKTVDETSKTAKTSIRPEEVLSKIPLLSSMVKSQQEAMQKPRLSTNSTDETKTVVTYNTRPVQPNLREVTQNFLYTEQMNCSQEDYVNPFKSYDTNVSDDIKVSRHSYGSLERQTSKSDDAKAKTEDNRRHVSNVSVVNGDSELHSLELTINEPSELYTTALDTTIKDSQELKNDSKVTITTPDLIKNVTLAEAISTLNNDINYTNSLVTVETPKDNMTEVRKNNYSINQTLQTSFESPKEPSSTLTYITEIKVTPNNGTETKTRTNISEIEIVPDSPSQTNGRNLDTEFENYVKSFESKLEQFENNIQDFDKNIEEFIKEEPKSIIVNETIDEKEVHKIQEIAEEQLKKLPEMRFTTSSYETSRIPEKRQSQIELLRSNFEKPIPKPSKPEVPKSRIPIATTAKTPPTSPERRDSRNLDNENDKALLELMSTSVTSTPYATSKYQIKSPNKNVTVTSIRNNSKIPSGLPVLGGNRPPIAPRRTESNDNHVVQVSTNGNVESSFKQWVFNPSNVTNVSVSENKHDKS